MHIAFMAADFTLNSIFIITLFTIYTVLDSLGRDLMRSYFTLFCTFVITFITVVSNSFMNIVLMTTQFTLDFTLIITLITINTILNYFTFL